MWPVERKNDPGFYNYFAFRKFVGGAGLADAFWSMMSSGDSPGARAHEVFDFKEAGQSGGRASPLPTTSKEVGVQSGGGVVQASVLVEPPGDGGGGGEEQLAASPTLHGSEDGGKRDEAEQTLAIDDLGDGKGDGGGGDEKASRKKGDRDKLDGVWVPEAKKPPAEDDADDNCVVKCLYVAMTCCECSIM
ncbi:uncharacterized protein LOC132707254 isoform X2 [Cylas formicarius]|uniref:uncharacterized protein LOC132707254 isoform X2 n=1 Tax=Cylas formicarius TaxID=197179 RepID=UPI002958BAAE|nr:uncharacterized protein LOC132707254 isoform X2 [Cylas formicarius]